MSESTSDLFWSRFDELVDSTLREAPVLGPLTRGELPEGDLLAVARRHYAEIRTFLDFKIPNRMRLCTPYAYSAKKLFWHLYSEEMGDFVAERDHANSFARLCYRIGISQAELDAEYEGYWPNYRYMLDDLPSTEAMVRELAVSCVWESVALRLGRDYLAPLGQRFDLDMEDLEYFTTHVEVDEGHSEQADEVLREYATTPDLCDLVAATVQETLIDRSPWVLKLV